MRGQAIPYLMFDGNARQALEFYQEVFGGELSELKTFKEAGYDNPEAADRLIHGRFKKGDLYFMVSDAFPGSPIQVGNNISLALDFESEEEILKIYDSLRQSGKVYMELQDTFWGAKYGKVIDQFGVIWDLNYQK